MTRKVALPARNTVYALAILWTVADRWRVLTNFATKWVDEDQAVFWYAVQEFKHGRFHEPRFFGQSYGTLLESLLAVPAVAVFRTPLNWALPVVTSLLGLSCFWIAAAVAARRKLHFTALLALFYPLILPAKYGMITSLPRSFVPGLTLAMAGAFALGVPVVRRTATQYLALGLALGLSVSLNPNSLIIILPLCVLAWWEETRAMMVLRHIGLGLGAAAAVHLLQGRFYVAHPAYDLNPLVLRFSAGDFFAGLRHVGAFWNDVSPLGESPVLIAMLLGAVCLGMVQRDRKALAVAAAGILPLVLSFACGKVHQGSASPFYPLSRMYLGIPLLVVLMAMALEMGWRRSDQAPRLELACLLILTGAAAFRQLHLSSDLSYALHEGWSPVFPMRVEELQDKCEALGTLGDSVKAGLVVLADPPGQLWHRTLNYGCAALLDGKMETLLAGYERRTWRLAEEEARDRSRMILFGFRADQLRRPENFTVSRLLVDPPILLVEMPLQKTLAALRKLGIETRNR